MNIQKLEQGATITVAATFVDKDGNPTTPADANVRIYYRDLATGNMVQVSLALSNVAGVFTVDWDSSVADGMTPAFWNVTAADAKKISAFGRIDFDFNAAGRPLI